MRLVTSKDLTTVEAAHELGVAPEEVYRLIFAGELAAEPDEDGMVRVAPEALHGLTLESSTPQQ